MIFSVPFQLERGEKELIQIVNLIKAINRRIRAFLSVAGWKCIYGKQISVGSLPICGGKIFVEIFQSGRIILGKRLSVRRGFEIRATGEVVIGDGCFFNNHCTLTALQSIRIGNNCIFGENVSIYDQNHAFRDKAQLIKEQGYTIAPVTIGNNVWVGSNVTILKGVKIGDNSVIGANCVVYKNVPANTIVKLNVQYD